MPPQFKAIIVVIGFGVVVGGSEWFEMHPDRRGPVVRRYS
jgi:hypothetical protein